MSKNSTSPAIETVTGQNTEENQALDEEALENASDTELGQSLSLAEIKASGLDPAPYGYKSKA